MTYSGRELIVQDQTGAVAVGGASPSFVSLGDEVEVRGSLMVRDGIPLVSHAAVRHLWAGSTPLPLAITPDEAAEGAYNGMLVTIEGHLIKKVEDANGAISLTLDSGEQVFTCSLEAGSPANPQRFTPGAVLRCTGVLSFNMPEHAFDSGTFLVLLRSANDVRVVTPAPWWTTRHLLYCLLLLLPLAFVGYHLHLHSVRARLALILEERLRIAREIHDTLAQGFAGIALQLHGVNRTMGEQSAATNAHLSMALQMVRRSRAEAHRSIAALRTLHIDEDLPSAMQKLLRQLTDPASLTLTLSQRGVPFPMDETVSGQILRIAQEAIANTVEHAEASTISITIIYGEDVLTVEIEDDGHGFVVEDAGALEVGHFGITGMRERAAHIRADFSIKSSPEGTLLRLQVPVSRPRARGSMFKRLRRSAAEEVER